MPSGNKRVKLYVAEEQQLLRDAYLPFLASHPGVEVVGSSGETSGDAVIGAVKALRPDVLLLGGKTLQPAAAEKLAEVRESCPELALILLAASYDPRGMKALREFVKSVRAGCAILLKQTIDTADQLGQMVLSVAQGRIVVDPEVMGGLISSVDGSSAVLKDLSSREVEVLSWMARGYRNDTVAEVLNIDLKTVERHINGIYSKLGDCPPSRHSRVYAVMLYLRATGQLPPSAIDS